MFGITDLTTYLIGSTAIILLPGPNSLYCLTVAGQHGVRAAYRAVGGILLGDSLLILATVLGAGTVLKLYPALFHFIKLAGGLYLAYIGWNLIRGGIRKWQSAPQPEYPDVPAPPAADPHSFKRALLLSLTNPKAILFLLSFFVQFVDPHYPNPALTFLALALILQTISLVYLNILVFAGYSLTRAFRKYIRLSAIGMSAIGTLFLVFAANMWRSSL